MIIGIVVLFVALTTLIWLVLWSRRAINRIARGDAGSAREIEKVLHDEQ